MTEDEAIALIERAQAFVDRKYVVRSDARQRAMGLAYVEAERVDLAREIANFVTLELTRAQEPVEELTYTPTQAALEAAPRA